MTDLLRSARSGSGSLAVALVRSLLGVEWIRASARRQPSSPKTRWEEASPESQDLDPGARREAIAQGPGLSCCM